MSNNRKTILASVAGALLLGTVLSAQADRVQPNPVEATLDLSAAMEVALNEVPGSVVEAELDQKKDGQLIWEFEIVSADEGTMMELEVDANSGELLSSEADGKHGHRQHK